MLKSFSGLWLLVFGPLFFLLYPSDLNPIMRFNEHIEGERFTEIYQGAFSLIEKQLVTVPVAQWQDHIYQLSLHFGYDLRLLKSSEVVQSHRHIAALQQGQIVFINAEPEYLLKQIGKSDFTLQLFTDFSEDVKISSGATGTVHLLRQIFDQTQPAQWPVLIQQLEEESPYHLRLKESESIELNNQEERSLETYSFFWRGNPSKAVTIYILLKGGEFFLIADLIPMSSVDTTVIILLTLLFVLSISVGMFLWIYPLWRDLKHLVSATSEFGKGNLATRAVVTKISVVAALSRAFNQMAEQTEHLVRGQKNLTNAIAHDLRTPLYRLRFASEMLMDSKRNPTDAKYWSSISRSIDDLDHLVNQTLLLSRYSSDKELIRLVEHELASLIDEECQQVFQLWPDIEYQLDLHLEPEKAITPVDGAAIKRAVSNLLNNACKYARSNVTVKLYYQQSSDEYVLEVSDDGSGIPEEEAERIFLPFEQLSNDRLYGASGHGLGLAIVRHIASWHSGAVEVGRSDLGGARFVLRWPAQ